jgi:hypothetical protein
MAYEVKVILDLSGEVQALFEQQEVNLYSEIQNELPAVKLEFQADPEAPPGSKDITTIILAAASLVSALTPIILRILNQLTPPNSYKTYIVDETETRDSNGRVIISRKRVFAINEQRTIEPQVSQPKSAELPILKETKESKE